MFILAKCELRPIRETDLALLLRWRNQKHIREMMYTSHLIQQSEHQAWFQRTQAPNYAGCHWLFSYEGIPLGQVNVVQIDATNRRCAWGFFIGEESAPPGRGTLMGWLALEKIFAELPVDRICGEALVNNERSIAYHKKLGFSTEGCLRQHVIRDGIAQDVICFGLLRTEWAKKVVFLAEKCFGEGSGA